MYKEDSSDYTITIINERVEDDSAKDVQWSLRLVLLPFFLLFFAGTRLGKFLCSYQEYFLYIHVFIGFSTDMGHRSRNP